MTPKDLESLNQKISEIPKRKKYKRYKLLNQKNKAVDLPAMKETIVQLSNVIRDKNLEFYLSDSFLYYLDRINLCLAQSSNDTNGKDVQKN